MTPSTRPPRPCAYLRCLSLALLLSGCGAQGLITGNEGAPDLTSARDAGSDAAGAVTDLAATDMNAVLDLASPSDLTPPSDLSVAPDLSIAPDLSPPAPTCSDGIKNGTETDVDCGDTCGGCADNLGCKIDGDCTSSQCDSVSATCGPPNQRIFDYTGAAASFTLPAGKTVTIKMWGAGGQNSGYSGNHDPGGGGGGFASAQVAGTGQSVQIVVGQAAPRWNGIAGPYFGGGGKSGNCGPSGAGGGRSQLALAGSTVLLVAGGGGGSGPGVGGVGGAGGGGAGGGTGSAVGAAGGTSTTGYAQFDGQDADDSGAAGGGGWYGGLKGSGAGCNAGGGGGGGSSYAAASVTMARLVDATGSTAGNSADADNGGAGAGGTTDWAGGTNGRVVISW